MQIDEDERARYEQDKAINAFNMLVIKCLPPLTRSEMELWTPERLRGFLGAMKAARPYRGVAVEEGLVLADGVFLGKIRPAG